MGPLRSLSKLDNRRIAQLFPRISRLTTENRPALTKRTDPIWRREGVLAPCHQWSERCREWSTMRNSYRHPPFAFHHRDELWCEHTYIHAHKITSKKVQNWYYVYYPNLITCTSYYITELLIFCEFCIVRVAVSISYHSTCIGELKFHQT